MITINKRVSLEFLGEEYKESYLVFNAVKMKDLDTIQEKAIAAQEHQDPKENLEFFQSVIDPRFVEGKISQDGKLVDVTKEDLQDLPLDVYVTIFQELMGNLPKAE